MSPAIPLSILMSGAGGMGLPVRKLALLPGRGLEGISGVCVHSSEQGESEKAAERALSLFMEWLRVGWSITSPRLKAGCVTAMLNFDFEQ